jgi:hypothetical protein
MKTCRSCHQTKPIDQFRLNAKSPDGHQNWCKTCARNYDNKLYLTPARKDQIRYSVVVARAKAQEFIWSYLIDHPCVDCGERDPIVLEFDHRGEAPKEFGVADMIGRGFGVDRIMKEISKCDVRCANCHRRKTAWQFGTWKTTYTPL